MNAAADGAIFWVVGLLFIGFGIYSGIRTRRLVRSGTTVQGEIVRYEERMETGIQRDSTGIRYHPVVRFPTEQGTVEHESASGTSLRGAAAGTTVEVRYRPEDPSRFEIVGGTPAAGMMQAGPIVLGVVCLAIGFGML